MNGARRYVLGGIAIIASIIVFIIPFVFIVLTALKTRLKADAVRVVLETTVPLPVADDIGTARLANR